MNDLVKINRRGLDEIFLSAQTPTMDELNGMVDGSVLAGRFALNIRLVRMILNLGWLPWRGKIFETDGGSEGKGINRFKVGPLKFLRYRCETRITGPLLEGTDVFCLNYDLSGNPWFIRRLRDDIRKIEDGLFLGTASFRMFGKHRFTIYFLLQSA